MHYREEDLLYGIFFMLPSTSSPSGYHSTGWKYICILFVYTWKPSIFSRFHGGKGCTEVPPYIAERIHKIAMNKPCRMNLWVLITRPAMHLGWVFLSIPLLHLLLHLQTYTRAHIGANESTSAEVFHLCPMAPGWGSPCNGGNHWENPPFSPTPHKLSASRIMPTIRRMFQTFAGT